MSAPPVHERTTTTTPCAGLQVAVTGASGLVGSALCARLDSSASRVVRLVRGGAESDGQLQWNPSGAWDASALEGFDAVVHLAGASIAQRRWTRARKALILTSRVASTRSLLGALARLSRPPKTLVCASGAGYYGNSSVRSLDEGAPVGRGFLAEVAEAWETEAHRAESFGTRSVQLRFGVVLSARGGVLAMLRLPFLFGLGGPLGGGAQGFPWIHIDDAVGAISWAVDHSELRGGINAVAPQEITQREFAVALAHALRRKAILPMPAAVVRLMLGQMGEELLLSGQFVRPRALVSSGFVFTQPGIDRALSAALSPCASG
ncbi:MAG: TIGR01777 family protein [Phycisphaerales bacterium]|nr:TIGR01777 family protein [Phycisphaerales bacterium]